MEEFGLEGEDAEDEGEGCAADVEEDLAGVDYAAAEVVEVLEDAGFVGDGFDGGEDALVEDVGVGDEVEAEEDGSSRKGSGRFLLVFSLTVTFSAVEN